MTRLASWWVIVLTLANILACVWLIWWTASRRDTRKTTGHVWDGDLEEYNNPLPRWWLGLFLITIAFSLVYLIIYPGLGNFPGLARWTQHGEHAAVVARHEAQFERYLGELVDAPVEQLALNPKAMSTARNLFGHHCSTCHGSDARGAKGFPDLTDHDWLWGGTSEAIQHSIAQGRRGVMPAWGAVLGEQGIDEVAAYVLSLSGTAVDERQQSAGAQRYATLCVACHGADGKGNPALGAPNLTDAVWLYGGSPVAVRESIAVGRQNQMPAHEALLGPVKTKLLTAYVLSLSTRQTE